jgi:hypothetical protein
VIQSVFRPIATRLPRRLTPVSAWIEHIPFGMALVDLLRPGILVELGTHAGDSYCAFCQAVEELRAPTRCYAVDTWQGDEHAGLYGGEVLGDLREHHDPLYGAFSRLVPSTFEAARSHFGDGTVDLLHVDGFHTYEAVRGDYDAWRQKLSPRAVVLFHDTNVRERNFGVWKLWQELSERHPHFEFVHGHGLGVLAPGEPPDPLRPLFDASEAEVTEVRSLFAELGQSVARERVRRELVEEHRRVQGELAERVRELADARSRLAHDEHELEALRAQVDRISGEAEEAATRLSTALDAARGDLDTTRRDLAAARHDLAAITGSKAWRVVKVLRSTRDDILRRGRPGSSS